MTMSESLFFIRYFVNEMAMPSVHPHPFIWGKTPMLPISS